LHLDLLRGEPKGDDLEAALRAHYSAAELVRILPGDLERLEPEALNGTDAMELRVHTNEKRRQAVLVARLDNLGKGASGAAVQCLKLMLGLPAPSTGKQADETRRAA
jgi:N-acetyl-gamma-glutamyl-phosphate reductase